MSLATLFGKLQEHEMELQCLNQNGENDKKKRSIVLKASSSMQEENEEVFEGKGQLLIFIIARIIKFIRTKLLHDSKINKRKNKK